MSDDNHSEGHNLEFNKLAASILLAGLIAMVCGFIADGFYNPKDAAKRGFSVEVTEDTGAGDTAQAAVITDAGTILASADAANGESLVQKKCVSCHDFTSGGPNKVGPNLYGIVGAKFAHKADFAYSDGVKNHGGNWDYQSLDNWLYAPAKYIAGTKMGFAGLKNDKERGDVIAYLKSISPGAPAYPAPAPAKAAAPATPTGKAAATPTAPVAKGATPAATTAPAAAAKPQAKKQPADTLAMPQKPAVSQ